MKAFLILLLSTTGFGVPQSPDSQHPQAIPLATLIEEAQQKKSDIQASTHEYQSGKQWS